MVISLYNNFYYMNFIAYRAGGPLLEALKKLEKLISIRNYGKAMVTCMGMTC